MEVSMKTQNATPPDLDGVTVDAEQSSAHDSPANERGLPSYPSTQGGKHIDPELGFDPDSPDLADPQIDPPHPPRIPDDAPDPRAEKRAPSDQYPPYEKP
jgi:hypothetical protein